MFNTIILSAGESRRFGSPKALANINNTTAIEQIQLMLLNSAVDEIFIVLGHQYQAILPHVVGNKRIKTIINHEYQDGQLSSVKCGLSLKTKPLPFLIWPVDCPLIQSNTIEALVKHHARHNPKIIVPTYNGRWGHPPLFSHQLTAEILQLPLNVGINNLYKPYPPVLLPLNDPGITQTFNTVMELDMLQAKQHPTEGSNLN